MKFSVVIPVYGTEKFLPQCLDSIKAQSDGDFEAIVVDDCSPSAQGEARSAKEIVAHYDSRFACVRHEKNRGAFQARCTGVAAATGDYVVPVDPDDRLLPETLAKVRAAIDREAPDLVSCWIDCEDGRKTWPHWCRHPAGTGTAREMLREIADHKSMYSIVSKVVRRKTYRQALDVLQLPADAYVNTSEDFLATLAILLCCDRVTYLDYAGYRYFSNPASITAGRRTADGFRRGCEQTRLVHDAIRDMAARVVRDPEVRTCVDEIIALSERWFCTEVMEGPADQVQELARVLFKTFRAETVGLAFADGYADLLRSRPSAFRLKRLLSGLGRRMGLS